MTYIDPEIEETEDDGEGENPNLKQLRNKAKKADKLEVENAELLADRRELAFMKAGVDTSTPVGSLFLRAYDGPLDGEAIKAAYAELGGSGESESSDEPQPEVEATRERQALASGATGDDGEQPAQPVRGLKGAAVKAGQDAISNGAPREDAIGATFGALVAAAASGDQSVIVPSIGQ